MFAACILSQAIADTTYLIDHLYNGYRDKRTECQRQYNDSVSIFLMFIVTAEL